MDFFDLPAHIRDAIRNRALMDEFLLYSGPPDAPWLNPIEIEAATASLYAQQSCSYDEIQEEWIKRAKAGLEKLDPILEAICRRFLAHIATFGPHEVKVALIADPDAIFFDHQFPDAGALLCTDGIDLFRSI